MRVDRRIALLIFTVFNNYKLRLCYRLSLVLVDPGAVQADLEAAGRGVRVQGHGEPVLEVRNAVGLRPAQEAGLVDTSAVVAVMIHSECLWYSN